MHITFSTTYTIGEIFCIVILMLLISSVRRVEQSTTRESWFTRAGLSDVLYLTGNASWRLLLAEGILKTRKAFTAFNILQLIALNMFTLSLFYYAGTLGEYKIVKDKKKAKLLSLPAIIWTAITIILMLVKPDWFVNASTLEPEALGNAFFLAAPVFYSAISLAYAINGIVKNKNMSVKRLYSGIGFSPAIVTILEAVDFYYYQVPLFAFSGTVYMCFICCFQLNQSYSLDSLTGLKSRTNLQEYLKDIYAQKANDQFYFFIIDMNDLRFINNVYGHEEGDRAIKAVAEAINNVLHHHEGMASRYGGGEFLAILKAENGEQADTLMQVFREMIATISEEKNLISQPRVTVGYSKLADTDSIEENLNKACEKLYLEKRDIKSEEMGVKFFTDEVTGLPNANYFHNFASSWVNELAKRDRKIAVVFYDIREMRAYNERYGFAKGNQLLRNVSEVIQVTCPDDHIVRYNDDNFVLLSTCPHILDKVKDAVHTSLDRFNVNIRAGIYYYTDFNENMTDAVEKARQALKYIGSNLNVEYCIYNDAVKKKLNDRDYVLTHFNEAIEKGWIKPFYQPEIRSLTGKVIGAEALARWIDPKLGILSPAVFTGVLEEVRIIHRLDLEIIRQVCELLSRKIKEGCAQPISVNISRVDFLTCDIFNEIEKIRKKHKVPSKYLKIEILESTLSVTPDQLREAIDKFHNAGYEVWMDDFGSGYSSFGSLKDFDFDLLKIDMTFLRDFDKNPRNKVIISSIVDIAKHLGLKTLCEGVETLPQAEFLKEIGCQRQQGYLYSKPVPEDEFEKMLMEKGDDIREKESQNEYYDTVSQINVLTNPLSDMNFTRNWNYHLGVLSPISIIEQSSNGYIHYMYTNSAYMNILKDHGFESIKDWEYSVNETNSFHNFSDTVLPEAKQKEDSIVSYQFMESRNLESETKVHFLAHNKETDVNAFVCSTSNLPNLIKYGFNKEVPSYS